MNAHTVAAKSLTLSQIDVCGSEAQKPQTSVPGHSFNSVGLHWVRSGYNIEFDGAKSNAQ